MNKIALLLSGGGTRALAFHIGTIQRLYELKLLTKVKLISCSSSASIIGLYLALNWDSINNEESFNKTIDKLYKFVNQYSYDCIIDGIRAAVICKSRTDLYEKKLNDFLFENKTLEKIPGSSPKIHINSANLVTGNRFVFKCGGGQAPAMYEHQLSGGGEFGNHIPAKETPISQAVAASLSHAFVFNPITISNDGQPIAVLTDGGIYDNLGLNSVLYYRENNRFNFVLVSDAGKPFMRKDNYKHNVASTLLRNVNLSMNRVRDLQLQRLRALYPDSGEGIFCYALINIQSTVKNNNQPCEESMRLMHFSSAYKTNLKKIDSESLCKIKNHAEMLTEYKITKYCDDIFD